jgi:hypothetical protein
MRLDDPASGRKSRIHAAKKTRVDNRIGVKDNVGVVPLARSRELLNEPAQSETFGFPRLIKAFEDNRASIAGQPRRPIHAVVRDNAHVIQLRRIVERSQTIKQPLYQKLFVVRGDQNRKSA